MQNVPKVSKFQAILHSKCPKCREGNIFVSPLISTNFAETNTNCPNCGVQFEREPSFWSGAMYIGYGFSVALCGFCFIFLNVFFDDAPLSYYMAMILPLVLLMIPVNFRYSRTIFLYLMGDIKYQDTEESVKLRRKAQL